MELTLLKNEHQLTAKDINIALYRLFENYEYKLNNTYVFGGWESDFFAQSKSGYFIEVEIKVSRSDFFVDFKKDKHRLFQDAQAGKTHHITRTPNKGHGDQLPLVREPYLALDHRQADTNKPLIERNYGFYRIAKDSPHMAKKYVVNDWAFDRLSIRPSQPRQYQTHGPDPPS
jgi:hypothetical protein